MTFPEDPLERCALSDILTEVAIMDDVTTLFLQASAAAARAWGGGGGGNHGAGDGDSAPSSVHRPVSAAAVAPMSRHHSSGGASDSSWHAGGGAGSSGSGSAGARGILHPSDGCPAACLLDYGITMGACWLVQARAGMGGEGRLPRLVREASSQSPPRASWRSQEKCSMSLRQWRVDQYAALKGSLPARLQLQLFLDLFACVLHRLAALHALGAQAAAQLGVA